MTKIPTVNADPWYTVYEHGTLLWQHAHGHGSNRCYINPGTTVHRNWEENWSRWIYVAVTAVPREHWTRWMGVINCNGWVDKATLMPK